MKDMLKIGVSGVRGVVGEAFTPQLAAQFAKAFGRLVGQGPVIVGRDTRPTGPMLEQAVVAGLLSVGCKPVLAGVLPTPSLLYLVYTRGARGGIMITASHNPVEWNALKFADRRGMFLNPIHTEELFDIYHQQDFPFVGEHDLRTINVLSDPVDAHFEKVIEYVDAEAIRRAAFPVAVDCCNGVGALYSQSFLGERLGCRVTTLFEHPSGIFEREPEPLPQNLDALKRAVIERGCAVGFAQDPDGDRLAVVDERGEPIGEEITIALALRGVLTYHARGPIVANLSAGKSVEDVARAAGCPISRTKTGEVYVSEEVMRVGAVAGGEHTGGIIIPGVHPCRDSYAGMAVVLEMMALTGKTISELCADIPRYCLIKEKIPIRADQAPPVLRCLRQVYEGHPMNFLDGLYIDFGDRWVHVRRSNTEPVLRVIAESPTYSESASLIEEVLAHAGLTR